MYEPVANFIQGKTESFIEGELLRVTQEMGLDVNREELLKALQYDRGQYEKGYQDGCRDSLKAGEWTTIEDDILMETVYKCSVCKEEFVTIDGETPQEHLWNYCPHCGAKMDGGNDDA